MRLSQKRKWAFLMAIAMLMGSVFCASAAYEVSQDYYFPVEGFNGERASDLLRNSQHRLELAVIVYSIAASNIDDIYATYEHADPQTKVYLATLTTNPHFFRLYLFAPGETWGFTCNTLFGQIVGGPMNYTMVPSASEMVMSSLQSEGSIGDYYPVSFYDMVDFIEGTANSSAPRTYTPASLNQRMSTRSGPGTQYTEELGTMDQSTQIALVEMVTTNGTPWGMVEFYRNGMKHRAYTGMKRINAHGPVAQGTLDYDEVVLSQNTDVYYGPGYDYAQRSEAVRAGTTLRVYGFENGFAMCDYKSRNGWVRAYFPVL